MSRRRAGTETQVPGAVDYDVTVLGCGNMGSALARTWAKNDLRVLAWNRTPRSAEALVGDGVDSAATLDSAVTSSPLLVLCMSNTAAALSVINGSRLPEGVVVVNLSDGTGDELEQLRTAVESVGSSLLDGAVFCYPDQIGRAEAQLAFSGSAYGWSRHSRALEMLGGRVRYVSEAHPAAKDLYLGSSSFFGIALAGFVESTTYLRHVGRSAAEVRDSARYCLELLQYATDDVVDAIFHDRYETDQATIQVFAAVARRNVAEIERAGLDPSMTAASLRRLEKAEEAGLGHLGFAAQARATR